MPAARNAGETWAEQLAHGLVAGGGADRSTAQQVRGGVRDGRSATLELLVADVLVDGDRVRRAWAARRERGRRLLLQAAGDSAAAAVGGGGQPDVDRLVGRVSGRGQGERGGRAGEGKGEGGGQRGAAGGAHGKQVTLLKDRYQ
jgi:hypothetical protein